MEGLDLRGALYFWIGLSKENGVWTWVDGTPAGDDLIWQPQNPYDNHVVAFFYSHANDNYVHHFDLLISSHWEERVHGGGYHAFCEFVC